MILTETLPGEPVATLPFDASAERSVLGLALMAREQLPKLRTVIESRDFAVPAYASIWDELCSAGDAGLPVEAVEEIVDDYGFEFHCHGNGKNGLLRFVDETGRMVYVVLPRLFDPWLATLEPGAVISDCPLPEPAPEPEPEPIPEPTPKPSGLPPYADAADFLAESLPMADPIIHGLLRRGEIGTVVSSSKARKSWMAAELLVDVATGGEWLGLRCRQGRGLLIDCELQPATLQHRLKAILNAKGIEAGSIRDRLMLTAWRGQTVTLPGLAEYLAAIQPGEFDLIVLDPIYRLYPEGFDENSNAAMAGLFGNFQALAERAQAALLLVCHSPKGDTSARTTIDMVAGAGSAGRAVDVAVALRAHEAAEPGRPVIVRETITRSFPDLAPACFRCEHPRWLAAPDLDPADLKRPGRRKKKAASPAEPAKPAYTAENLVADYLTAEPQWRDTITAKAVRDVPELNTYSAGRLLRHAQALGIVYPWKMPKDRKAYFANRAQPDLGEAGHA